MSFSEHWRPLYKLVSIRILGLNCLFPGIELFVSSLLGSFLLWMLNFVEFVECKWYSFNLDDGKNGVWMSKAVFPDCVGLEISKDHEKMKWIIDLTSLDTFF